VLVQHLRGLRPSRAGQCGPQQAGLRARNVPLAVRRRRNEGIQAVDGPREGYVQHAQRLGHRPVGGILEHPLERSRQQLLNVRTGVAADAIHGQRAIVAVRHHQVGLPDDIAVQFRQHDDVELQALGLMNGHDADVGRNGIRDLRAFDESDELVRPKRRRGVEVVRLVDQLLQSAQFAAAAVRGQGSGPTLDRRAVAVLDQRLADLQRHAPRRRVVAVILQAGGRSQRRMRYVKAGHRVAGMIGDPQQRQDHVHGRRIGQRIAAFLAGGDVQLAQFVDQPRHAVIAAHQHADTAARSLIDQFRDPCSGGMESNFPLRFLFTRRRSRRQFHVAGQFLPLRRVPLESLRPALHRRLRAAQVGMLRDVCKDVVDRVDHRLR